MSKIGIILCILIVILITMRYFDPFDKGRADWEKCKESLLIQIISNKCTLGNYIKLISNPSILIFFPKLNLFFEAFIVIPTNLYNYFLLVQM